MDSSTDPRPTLAAPDDDPWLWLEEVEGENALAWVEAQNAATLARLADARFEADGDAVKAALDRPDKLPFVTRRGGLLYNFWQDAAQAARGLAAYDPRFLSQPGAGVGGAARPRRLGAGGGRGLGLEGRHDPARHA